MKRTLVLVLLVLVLVGCGAGEADLAGQWTMIDWTLDATQPTLDLLPDGRYIINASGYNLEGLWKVDGGQLCGTINTPEDWRCVPYSLEDDYLTTAFVWVEEFTFRKNI